MNAITISTTELHAIRKAAQIVYPKAAEVAKKKAQIAQLQKDVDAAEAAIASMDSWVKHTYDCGSMDLIQRVVTPLFNEDGTPKLDPKSGKHMTKVEWPFNEGILTKLEKGGYALNIKTEEAPAEAPAETETPETTETSETSEVFDPTTL